MNEQQMKKRTLTFWILDCGFWINLKEENCG